MTAFQPLALEDRLQRLEHVFRDERVTAVGEMDDVEIEIVVPDPVDARSHVNERNSALSRKKLDQPVVGGVGGDDIVDRLEDSAVKVFDLARRTVVDRYAGRSEDEGRAIVASKRDQL